MFVITRFFDNGYTDAQISESDYYKKYMESKTTHDFYVDEVESVEQWVEDNLEAYNADAAEIVSRLENGQIVNITKYV